ncbi:Ig-like domain-containing protein [Undibacterium cyanobacteriorum]|uniref:Ig-like domain-containing protein n=1 Tax=Undibacterium cyanobacteriorum TaxID=3073561 RepID=A0ABY9RGQ4_9BURK|nr:Ig-like domain-containing protein [Undibacterium sp. 20NA77.5]WMW80387.1 Ig-like domain-containing protein [Undibacterium sp. 20NA77.5]
MSKLYDYVIHKRRRAWNAFLLCFASSIAVAAVVNDTSLPPDTIINVSAQQGVNFSQSFKGIGTTDNIYTLTEALPAGLTATTVPGAPPSSSNHSLVISGTPTVAGTFLIPVRITATSASTDTAGGVFTYSTSINFTISAGPPTVQNQSVNISQDSTSNTISLTTTGDIYQIQIASAPTHGAATTSGTDLIYTPTAGYYGSDSISVLAIGPTGTSAVATISINVQATAPSIVVSPVSVFANTSNNIIALTLTGVVNNLVLETAPAHGTASISGTQVLYTPTVGYVGNDSLTLKAQGPGGDSRSTPVAITVNAPPPVSVDYAVTVSANSNSNTIHPPITGTYTSLAVDSGPSNGSVVVSGKDLIYTPTPGFSGSDSIKFKAIATASNSNVSTLSITVLPPAPSITGTSVTVPGNSSNFIINSTVTGLATSLTIASPSSHGTVTVSGMHFEYTPNASYAGSDSFTAYASGPGGNSSTVTFSVTVQPIAPSTSNMSLTVAANSSNNLVVIPIVGVASSSTVSIAPSHGTVAGSGLNFSYTPNAGYDGNDSFSYIVVGPGGSSAAATASIVVLPPAPTASNSALTVAGNSVDNPVNLSTNGNVTGITIVTAPSHGSARVSGTNVFYTPSAAYSGSDSLMYVATGPGGSSSNASVSITVQAIPPSMSGASLNVPGNSSNFEITPSITGNATGLTVVSAPTHGTVTTSGLQFQYTPTSNYSGADFFTAYARGPGGNSSTVTFSLTVLPIAPSTSNTSVTVIANSTNNAITIPVVGSATGITISTAALHGTVQVSGLSLTYTPTTGYDGNDSFSYYLVGPGGNSNTASASITVQALPPVASNSSFNVAYNSNDNQVPLSVTGNFASVNLISAPSHGYLRVSGASVFYTPTVEFSGNDSFTYTATGPGGTSSQAASVSLTVATPALTMNGATVSVPGNASNFVITPTIIGNPNGLSIVTPAAHGTVISNGLHFEYTPTANYSGSDSFTAYARSLGGNSSTVTFNITVQPSAPSTSNTSAAVLVNSTNNAITIPVVGNATSLSITGAPLHGTVQVSGLTASYTPSAGYVGNDSFSYSLVGPGGNSNTASASIVVQPLLPTASNSSLTVASNSSENSVVLTTGGQVTGLNIISAPTHGSLRVSGTSVFYTPAVDFYGVDSFSYIATGPAGNSNNAAVSINVVAAAPSISASSITVATNSNGNLITPNITGRADSISIINPPAHGSAQVIGLKLSYTPTAAYSGSDQIVFQAQGPGGDSGVATISITVQAGVIIVQNLQFNVAANSSANTLTPLISGAANQLAIQTAPTHGSAIVNGLSVLYTPSTNYVGTDNITISVSGSGLQPTTATLVVNVTAPAPTIAVADTQILANTANVSLTPQLTGLVDSLLIVTPPNHGSASVNGLTLSYTPNANYVGLDNFVVIAKGLGGNSAPATVQIKVNELPPVVNNDSLNVVANSATNAYTPKVTGAASSISISKQPTHGSVSVNGMAVNYIPSPGYVGPDSFSVVANGAGGTSTPADISINVQALAGITEALNVATNETGTATFTTIAGASAYVISTPPQHGTANIQANQLRYTPSTNYVGNDVVRITVNGSNGALTSITYNIAVVATAPTTRALSLQVESGRTVQIDLATAVSGPVYSGLTLKIVTPPSHGTASLNGSTLSYTANSSYAGSDQLQFTASTIGGTSNLANLSIAITARPDPSQDKGVLALANATSAIVRHFEQIQIEQFNGRLIELQSQYRSRSEITGKQEKDCGPIAMWLSGLNSYGSYRTRDGSHYTTMAYSAGGDRCFASGKVTGGFGLGYARDHAEIAPSGINLTSSANTAAGYMNANIFPKGRIGFVAGTNQINTGYQRFEPNSNAIAYGQWNGTQTFSSSSVSNDFDFGVIVFSPFVRFDLSNMSLDPYSETGASKYNLHYHAQSMKSRRSTVGFNSEMSIETAWGKLVPRLRAEFQRDSARRDTLKTNYVDFPDAVYLIPASDSDRRATLMMIGADMYWSNGIVTILNFNHTSANQGSKNNRISLRFSYQF